VHYSLKSYVKKDVGHVVCIGDEKWMQKFRRIPERKWSLHRRRFKYKDNIKTDTRKRVCDDEDRIKLSMGSNSTLLW